jgi:hypothetical protein
MLLEVYHATNSPQDHNGFGFVVYEMWARSTPKGYMTWTKSRLVGATRIIWRGKIRLENGLCPFDELPAGERTGVVFFKTVRLQVSIYVHQPETSRMECPVSSKLPYLADNPRFERSLKSD